MLKLFNQNGFSYLEQCHVYFESNNALILTDCPKPLIGNLLTRCEALGIPMINAYSKTWLKPGRFPGEKKVQPYQTIIRAFPEHKLIVDLFMGSGSTGLAAIAEDRDFIGVEINAERFLYAKSRLEDAAISAAAEYFP